MQARRVNHLLSPATLYDEYCLFTGSWWDFFLFLVDEPAPLYDLTKDTGRMSLHVCQERAPQSL